MKKNKLSHQLGIYILLVSFFLQSCDRLSDLDNDSNFIDYAIQKGPEAQYKIGILYQEGKGGVEQDEDKAAEAYIKAAEEGYKKAADALKDLADQGNGVAKIWIIKKMAGQGSAAAQNKLGDLYYYAGYYWEAMEWYAKAANQGDAQGQYNMGCVCSKIAVEQQVDNIVRKREFNFDPDKDLGLIALEWYQKAADQGHAHAKAKVKELTSWGCILY